MFHGGYMLTVARVGNGTAAQHYYEKDDKALDYYTGNNGDISSKGIWYGNLKDSLKLSDNIDYEQFLHIANGFNKDGSSLVLSAGRKGTEQVITTSEGKEVRLTVGSHRAGIDLTFSAPKSASILAMEDKRIIHAFDKSVKTTLDKIEREYIQTRIQKDGVKEVEMTNKMLAGMFSHLTSRENDPQVHTHCLIMNITQDSNGQYKTTHMDNVFKDQKLLGQYQRSEFANNLRELGYNIDVTDRNNGLFEIADVDKEVIDSFSKRTQVIKEKIEQLKLDDKYKDLEEWKLAKIATLGTRKGKQEITYDELRANVSHELAEHGYTLSSLQEKALSSELNTDKNEAVFYVREAISVITDNHSVFKEDKVLETASKFAIEHYTNAQLSDAINSIKHSDDMLHVGIKNGYEYFTTSRVIDSEEYVINKAETESSKINISNKEYFNPDLTPSQNRMIHTALNTDKMITTVQGDAGTGKTTALRYLNEIMKDEHIKIRGLAPTGRAAHELSTSADIEGMTVHSFMNHNDDWFKGNINKGSEVWVINEAGMLGSIRMQAVIEKAVEYDVNVILIGDKKQFMPIEQGKIFDDIQKHKDKISYVEMSDIVRQKTEYTKMAVAALSPEQVHNAITGLKAQNRLIEIDNKSDRYDHVLDAYLSDKRDSKLIITSRNTDKNELNYIIRAALKSDNKLSSGSTYNTYQHEKLDTEQQKYASNYAPVDGVKKIIYIQKDIDNVLKRGVEAEVIQTSSRHNKILVQIKGTDNTHEIDTIKYGNYINAYRQEAREFAIGDKVITLKNDSMLEIKNGFMGTVSKLDNGNMTIALASGDEININVANEGRTAYNYIDHAYAVTEYKAQGATVDHIVWDVDADNKTHFNNTYVAITRAREDITIVTNSADRLIEQASNMQDKLSVHDFKEFDKGLSLEKEVTATKEYDLNLSI
ncbi:MAG TPA: hypothetical protein DCX03_04465 [Bacteroidales bacterium]|nr:hypothetical protein [Bacteroidales bacterium]